MAVSYFITNGARSLTIQGVTGHGYQFSATTPIRVSEPRDADTFRRNPRLMECDEEGQLLGAPTTARPVPLSYVKLGEERRVTTSADPKDNVPLATRAR